MDRHQIKHMLAHWFGWNHGSVATSVDSENNVWVGFRCHECGKISGRHIVLYAEETPDIFKPNTETRQQ